MLASRPAQLVSRLGSLQLNSTPDITAAIEPAQLAQLDRGPFPAPGCTKHLFRWHHVPWRQRRVGRQTRRFLLGQRLSRVTTRAGARRAARHFHRPTPERRTSGRLRRAGRPTPATRRPPAPASRAVRPPRCGYARKLAAHAAWERS